jgi:hypothetical protein
MKAMIAHQRIALALFLLCLAPPAVADDPAGYDCRFTSGATHAYEKGAFTEERTYPLTFGIAAIDAQAQTAELRTKRGTGKLRVVQAVNAVHFLEVVTEGFLHVTTIYDKDEVSGAFPAVHSRHFGLFGQPIVSQYQGFCTARSP